MASPKFLLARKTPEFRRYVLGFGLELALTSESALTLASRSGGGGESGQRTGGLLRAALPHFDETAYRRRMESVVRLCAISMGYHARQRRAFRGASSELFLSSLIDEMVGLLSTPVSADTKTIAKSIKSSRK